MMERQLLLPGSRKLFAMLYRPDRSFSGSDEAFLLIHPFAEEKKSAQRILVALAKSICEQGHSVLLFDLSGCGESFVAGQETQITIAHWIEDIDRARSFLMQETGVRKIDLIGVRMGAYLALLYSRQMALRDDLLLIAPVLEPMKHLKQLFRGKQIKELCTAGRVSSRSAELSDTQIAGEDIDFDGHLISGGFMQSLRTVEKQFSFSELLQGERRIDAVLISGFARQPKDPFAGYPTVSTDFLEMPEFWNRGPEVNPAPLCDRIIRLVRHE